MNTAYLYNTAIALLQQLIATPSFSREEDATANILEAFLKDKGIIAQRHYNNVWAANKYYDAQKPTLLLNSHHDTVKPNASYSIDPFDPVIRDGKLYGLGSNDAGGCLVSLLVTFLHFYDQEDLKYNLVFAASAEEEISGKNGIQALLPVLGNLDCAIVGEPTLLNTAVAEKGLMVLDCTTSGVAGHAAREEGENALYKALEDIEWFWKFQFDKVSSLLGPVKMSVTQIESGTQHNVVPDSCKFTVDIRVNECYSLEEILDLVRSNVHCNVTPRSMRLRSSGIDPTHPLVQAASKCGGQLFGSATLSDKALLPFPAIKIGPGDSARSHTSDEFIYLHEIEAGIKTYIQILNSLL